MIRQTFSDSEVEKIQEIYFWVRAASLVVVDLHTHIELCRLLKEARESVISDKYLCRRALCHIIALSLPIEKSEKEDLIKYCQFAIGLLF